MQFDDLRGKRVLITGASGGLGAGMAKAFAAQGAKVLLHYRSREAGAQRVLQQIQTAGGKGALFYADLRSEMALERLVSEAWRKWDGIDILVNNAGIVLKASMLDAGSVYWDDVLNINLRAPYLLSRAVVKRMIAAEIAGVIINNSSIHAKKSVENFSAYAASKAGLESLTEVMALEWAKHGIRVNAVAPGVVPVERTHVALKAAEGQWLPHLPLQRYGLVEEIANLTLFLSSDVSAWTTGQSYVADGGMTARMDMPKRPQPELPVLPDEIDEV
ncbi:MAG: SDR family NAD(P)-dependent oxidoreductase [Gammaproteobacteria bacterium]|nr:SDR family NAD(P)-dependent oxidoreductase [Gammaproteobacteria bacterium]